MREVVEVRTGPKVHSFAEKLERARGLADIFELVKEVVRRTKKTGRAGLSLGLTELGNEENLLIGAFYPFGSNIIVMNKTPLRKILETDPRLFKPYTFHVLLHEYLHTLGILDEAVLRETAYKICKEVFGPKHLATQMAEGIERFLPNLLYPPVNFQPKERLYVEMVRDFDRSSMEYIA